MTGFNNYLLGDRLVSMTGQFNKVWAALCHIPVTVVLIVFMLYENWLDFI